MNSPRPFKSLMYFVTEIKDWSKKATRAQNISLVSLSVLILWPFQAFISGRFIPHDHTLKVSLWASIVCTLIYLTFMAYTRFTMPESKRRSIFSRRDNIAKKIFIVLSMPFGIYCLFWVNIAVSAPQLFTVVFGKSESKTQLVIKHNAYSRYSCDFRLKLLTEDFWLYRYCISYREYTQLPEKALLANVSTRVSSLGTHYRKIEVIENVH